jgi:competence protein ComGC
MARKVKGYTLVDLSGTIAILAMLAIVLVPVISRAADESPAVTCESNLRQIGTGLALYEATWNSNIPFIGRGKTPDGNYWGLRILAAQAAS